MGNAENSEKQRGRPFEKGDSRINRGGRPKGYNAFRKKFRDREKNDKLREDLYAMATDPETPAKDRLMAMRLYWEYGWGKSPAAPDDNDALRESGAGGLDFSDLTREEKLAIARGETP